jgi:muramoyltetrapeptide carboxypeptidase
MKNNFTARVHPGIIEGDIFFAAPLKQQLEMMKDAVYSDSKMLWSLRGGYGSMRLIPFMEKWKKPKQKKVFMGFSDVTSLHLFFGQNWGWQTIHGRNVSGMNLNKKSKDRNEIISILTGKKDELVFKGLRPLNVAAKKSGKIKAAVTGGNLKLLQTSIGTSWELNARGKILFMEDVGERGYAVDRMLEQLWQSGVINKSIKAVVFGDFIEGEEKNGQDLTGTALQRFADRVPFPVYKGLKCGHGEVNFSLPFHSEAEISGNILKVMSGGASRR